MNRQDAIKKLVLAGRSEEVQETIESYLDASKHEYRQIREDTTISDDYRLEMLKNAFESSAKALTDDLVKMAGTAVVEDKVDAAGVFGWGGLSGDTATLMIARRDAGDRVRQIDSDSDLMDMLNSATRIGDEVMARAVAEKALESRYNRVLEKFIEDRPSLKDATVRLWDAELRKQATGVAGFSANILISGMKPSELGGLA